MMLTDDHLREGMEQLKGERHALALEQFTLAADNADSPEERRAAEAFAAQVSLTLGRPYEAVAWAERLRESSPTADEANVLEASAWIALADGARALSLLDSVDQAGSTYTNYPDSLLHQLRGQAYGLVGDVEAALVEAFTALRIDWALPEIWQCVANLAARHDIDVADAVARVPHEGVIQVLGWLIDSPATGADRIVEAIWERSPGSLQVLALVSAIGNRLSLERALEWSARLRAAGLADNCAVLGIAATESRPARERVRAAAIAAATFQDGRAMPLIEVAASNLPDEDVTVTFHEVLKLAPDDLVDCFVVATATSAPRSLRLAHVLLELGAVDPAVALTRHALEQTTGQPDQLRSALTETFPAAAAARLVAELEARGAPALASLVDSASA